MVQVVSFFALGFHSCSHTFTGDGNTRCASDSSGWYDIFFSFQSCLGGRPDADSVYVFRYTPNCNCDYGFDCEYN